MTWNQMASGCAVDLIDPRPEQFNISDIAWHIAGTRRFHGIGISVAEHSCYVSELVPERFARAALLHDAAEAVCGDVAQPLKVAMRALMSSGLGSAFDLVMGTPSPFDQIERGLVVAVCRRFDVSLDDMHSREVRDADLTCMVAEKHALWADHEARPWNLPTVEEWDLPADYRWSTGEAASRFLRRAEELGIR